MGVGAAVVLIGFTPVMCLLLILLTRLENWLEAEPARHRPGGPDARA